MYAVILAGGSGTRLWPLSREHFPKQYLNLGGSRGEAGESLFIDTVRRALRVTEGEKIVVVTHRDQAGVIGNQLDRAGIKGLRLLAEPEARNTAPAIGLAARFVAAEAGSEEVMAVLPSDHLIADPARFAELLNEGAEAARRYGLVTFGIKPSYPETGYGYIRCGDPLEGSACRVDAFVEKPDRARAEQYLAEGNYLWNSGMFLFQVGALLDGLEKHLPGMAAELAQIDFSGLENLEEIYPRLVKTSIDYGLLEKAEAVSVIPANIGWSDLGSWEAYYQVSPRDSAGNALRGRVVAVDTENCLVEATFRLVGVVGVNDLAIIETADALLVCDRRRSQDVREIVETLKEEKAPEAVEHKTVYRPWGSYTSLEVGTAHQVKRINVNPGSRLSLQSHNQRAENWVVVSGEAVVTVNERQLLVREGETVYIPREARHRLENRGPGELVIVEVQRGSYLGEDDIIRYEDDYGRTASSGETPASPAKPAAEEEKSAAFLGGEGRSDAELYESLTPDPEQDHGGSGAKISPFELYERWLAYPDLDGETRKALEAMKNDPAAIESHFGRELEFGTGGMRGIIGPGLNRINFYVIRRATQGLADYINSLPLSGSKKVAIAYDTRRFSDQYAVEAALVLAANGIRALVFKDIRPTPALSFVTRELGCAAGIVITASHNPPDYNGYKVYGPDGGQAVSPLVDQIIEAIGKVDIFNDVQTFPMEEAKERGLYEEIDPAYDRAYLTRVRELSLNDPETCISLVYTPLHGTGSAYIPDLLRETHCVDLHLVEEQLRPDPDFSTVRVPNPEDPAALELALKKASRVKAELVLATDPDSDRVGTAVRGENGEYTILSGNQVGALLIEYICSSLAAREALPSRPVMVKTIVTGELGSHVARSYGLDVVETLTGFKFIGEKMQEFEDEGAGGPQFVFGYEESCGYLTGTFVRDKDAVIATYLIAEMAAYYKGQGKNLLQVLEDLHRKHGYFAEELQNVALEDIAGADRYVENYRKLGTNFAGQPIIEKRDYEIGIGWKLPEGELFNLGLPRSPVLHYTLEDGSWFAVRPSGTEPKVKFYLSAAGQSAEEAAQKLSRLREAIK